MIIPVAIPPGKVIRRISIVDEWEREVEEVLYTVNFHSPLVTKASTFVLVEVE